MIEVEMKFKGDHNAIRSKLIQLGNSIVKSERQADIYFGHPCKDLKETDEALRIRTLGDSYEITYKGSRFDDKSKSREEINIEIRDKDNFLALFDKMGFTQTGKVDKEREVWVHQGITISLDRVVDLGDFIEFEVIVDNEEEMQINISKIKDLVRSLGMDPDMQILSSYLTLIEEKSN